MAKTVMNPINPEIKPADYERIVGDKIWNLITNTDPRLKEIRENLFGKNPGSLKRKTVEMPKWEGASGYKHQIDESFSSDDTIILVECKHLNTTVDVPTFLAFLARVIDIKLKYPDRFVKGIMVTTQGPDGRLGTDPDGIGLLQTYFDSIGYHIEIQIVPD